MGIGHPPIILHPNQFMIKCMPQNYFFQFQDMYKGYTNSLQIKLPYLINKTTLLNIFLFYGKIEHIDINTETNIILIEYYKIISAIKCYSEFTFNFKKLSNKDESQTKNVEIKFIQKSFEDKFFLGIKIKEKEVLKTKINTDCLIKIISKVGKILKIHQKMSFEFIAHQQYMCINTILVFNDSRDKEKAEFILRRIIYPYASHNPNNNCNMNNNGGKKYEETKDKDENKNGLSNIILNINNNTNVNNNNNNNSVSNFNIIFESENNLNNFPLIYQYMKKDDDIELKDDYEIQNKKCENEVKNNMNKNEINNKIVQIKNNYENDENVNTMNMIQKPNNNNYNNYKNKHVISTISSDINKLKYTGIKQRNTPAEERVKYIINLEKIINETDQRTTLMIKNIPRNIIQSYLMEIINKKFKNLFNFFYLPIDFIKKENAGYAFINFKNSKHIVDFYIEFNEKPWPFCPNRKCFISYARIQGFRAITQHFSSSNIMLVNNGEVKPYISDE
jgi:hypothetical protein